MEKKSVVKETNYRKSFAGKFGETFIHEIIFENGDKGEYLSKQFNQDKFVVGQETAYHIDVRQNGKYTNTAIKPVENKGGFTVAKQQRSGNESFSLSYAKDVAVAHIGQGKEFKSSQIIQVAEEFYSWLESKKK